MFINGQRTTITERDEAHGLLAQRDFGGTRKWRTCYVSDGTGHAMITALADQAMFGCMSLLACHDLCPKNLPLQTQITFMRRKMVAVGLR